MKEQVKTPVIVVAAIVAAAILIFIGFKTLGSTGDLDQGQVQYTPGKPPWEETDPNKRGPGGAPGSGEASPPTAPPPQSGMPVSPPAISNGG